jgi:hypothetical protein
MKFAFKFPRVEGETIMTEGNTFGEAADKAIAERIARISPIKADGEVADKASLTNPRGVITGS